ncbi:MAG: hypothetical protein D8H94_04500 [Cardiobacterium sp.]|nr:MAG: hypothetical protein D8H94_04500 [Cardiobacterium sp.]
MTDNTLLTPEQFARDLAETISRQFQTRVSIQLNRHQPEHTHLHVHLAQPLTLPLQHLYRRYQEHPEELQKLIAFELQRISEHTIRQTPADDPEAILPQIKSAGWLQELQKQLAERQPEKELKDLITAQPYLADLFICYVYECPAGLRYLSQAESEALGYGNPLLLRTRAIKNLRKRKHRSKLYRLEGGAYSLVLDGVYDASLLLIIDEILPPGWLHSAIFAAPSRGELLFAKDDSPANLQELQTLVNEVSTKTAHPVSPHLYRWQDGQLHLYRANTEL